MAKIKQIVAREIFDAKGNPTVEATVILQDNAIGIASCPSGTSMSSYEALELRDGDQNRFLGRGVQKAVGNIMTSITPRLIGMEAGKQPDIDKAMIELDGTQNKSRMGANAMLSVSMAVAKAAAKSSVLPLYLYLREFTKKDQLMKIPSPIFNLINGGKHAEGSIDLQEFQIVPASSKTYGESLHMAFIVYNALKEILRRGNFSTLVGDEGGFSPLVATNEDALLMLSQAIESANLRLGYDIFTGLDAAASSFHGDGLYKIHDRAMRLTANDLTSWYETLIKKYNVLYLEDALSEDDWDGWTYLASRMGPETIVTGDDLTSTNPYRLQMALNKKTINGIIIKPNQIGTVIETMAVVEVARAAGLKIIVSHRSGETNDDFIADFSVAVAADYCKFGAPVRGERVAKYNRLLQIEQQMKVI